MIVKDSFQLVPEETRSRQDVLITWILRVAVAVVFFSVGSSKFDATSMWVKLFDQIGVGQWFRYLTGILQIAGAVLVLVPRTFLAGIGLLALTMAGAAAIWIARFGQVGNAVIPLVVLAALLVVGVHGSRVDRQGRLENVPSSDPP
ncbi:MAG TPA: DoxX family protein [Vicinamibacterales bacterium]|nr:DoxX family protein [Vicinamibacterales bacterium]